ncbi:MAG: hypothetical protein U0792_04785 [Gemmataceae bacterium]
MPSTAGISAAFCSMSMIVVRIASSSSLFFAFACAISDFAVISFATLMLAS